MTSVATQKTALQTLRSLYTPLEAVGIGLGILLILFFLGIVEWRTVYQKPPILPMTDLEVYLRSAWAVRTGQDIYQITDEHGWHYVYPPLVAICFVPLAAPPPGSADWNGAYIPVGASVAIWYLISVTCVLFAVQCFASAIEGRDHVVVFPPKPSDQKRRYWKLRMIPVLIALPAIMTSLDRGQMESLTMLLIAAALLASVRGRQWAAGLWLAGAICIKLLPVMLLVYPLWRRQWKFLASCAVGIVIGLLMIPGLVLGPARTYGYYREFSRVMLMPSLGLGTDRSRENELIRLNGGDGESILSSLHNVIHIREPRNSRPEQASASVWTVSMVISAALLTTTLWAAGWRQSDDGIAGVLFFGLLIVDLLMTAPKSHSHYYCLIVPLVMGIVAWGWQKRGRIGWLAISVLVIYLAVDTVARLGKIDYQVRDLGIPTAAALAVWGLGIARLAQDRLGPHADSGKLYPLVAD